MTITSMSSNQTTTEAGLRASLIRALVAQHLGVDVERVTEEAHFSDDLGAGWLDRLELMIMIEDQFEDVEISDDEADQISVVGDLIRHVEGVAGERTGATPRPRRSAAATRKFWGLRRSRPAWKAASHSTSATR